MSRRPSIALLLALSLLAGGCGAARTSRPSAPSGTGRAAGTSAPGSSAADPAPGSCAPGAHTICIMASDAGRTIPVRVGTSFTVELRSPGESFSEPTESGAKVLEALARSRSGAAAEGYYRALAPGRVQIRAVERPLCRRGRACPMFIRLWFVTVLVSR